MKPHRIAITGASGFVGSALVAALRRDTNAVLTIGRRSSRRQNAVIPDVEWDPATGSLDTALLEGVDAVVHLAGASIGRRWTSARKREIRDSRVAGTQLMAHAIAQLRPEPRALIVASATGYYGDRGDEWLDEESSAGSDFLAEVVLAWEGAAEAARAAGVRVVHLRSGLVLGKGGGALARLLPAFNAGLGGRLGDGRQWMSWITLADLVSAYRFALENPALEGAVNAVSPSPVTNATFTGTLARVLGRPAAVPVPSAALRFLFGEMAVATVLASQRVRPARLLEAGFTCEHRELEEALRSVLGR